MKIALVHGLLVHPHVPELGARLLHRVGMEYRVLLPPVALQVKVLVLCQTSIAKVHGLLVHPHVKLLVLVLGLSLLHKVVSGLSALQHPPVNQVKVLVH